MLEAACSHQHYDYYHLISGVDFPIKSNAYIKEFLQKNNGKEFIGFKKTTQEELYNKYGIYHFFNKDVLNKYPILNHFNKILIGIQKIFRVHRANTPSEYKGCNWWSITDKLANNIILNKKEFLKRYRYTSCSDEVFLQQYIIENSNKYDIYNIKDEYSGCMRYIDWKRGQPYTWQEKDFQELIESPYFFARKFSEEHMGIINKLANYLKEV